MPQCSNFRAGGQQPGDTFATGLGPGGGSVPLNLAARTLSGLHPSSGSMPLTLLSAAGILANASTHPFTLPPGGTGKLVGSGSGAFASPLGLGLPRSARGTPGSLQPLAEDAQAAAAAPDAAAAGGSGLGKSSSEDMVSRLNMLITRGEAKLVEGGEALLALVHLLFLYLYIP